MFLSVLWSFYCSICLPSCFFFLSIHLSVNPFIYTRIPRRLEIWSGVNQNIQQHILMIRRNKTWELQVFAGYIRHTGILLPKERFMKWGHHPHKFPKVNGPSWISTLWRLKKGNNHIPTISPKIVPKMFEFVNRVFFNDPREFLPECREFLPECRVFLPVFFAKKNA